MRMKLYCVMMEVKDHTQSKIKNMINDTGFRGKK
jgi:hypothetical protein